MIMVTNIDELLYNMSRRIRRCIVVRKFKRVMSAICNVEWEMIQQNQLKLTQGDMHDKNWKERIQK